jgi:hypothetical protein
MCDFTSDRFESLFVGLNKWFHHLHCILHMNIVITNNSWINKYSLVFLMKFINYRHSLLLRISCGVCMYLQYKRCHKNAVELLSHCTPFLENIILSKYTDITGHTTSPKFYSIIDKRVPPKLFFAASICLRLRIFLIVCRYLWNRHLNQFRPINTSHISLL